MTRDSSPRSVEYLDANVAVADVLLGEVTATVDLERDAPRSGCRRWVPGTGFMPLAVLPQARRRLGRDRQRGGRLVRRDLGELSLGEVAKYIDDIHM
jgi:hypothetical protein